MKIRPRRFNPISGILQSIPNATPEFLTVEQVGTIVGLLALGGVHCESNNDTLACLKLLDELNLLDVELVTSNNTINIKVGNKYNGK